MSLITITLIGSVLLSLFPHSTEAYGPQNFACCLKYTRKPLPFAVIKGFIEQSSLEVCRLDAIIFFTRSNRKICASVQDQWVRAALVRLRSKIATLESRASQGKARVGINRINQTTTNRTRGNQ